MIADTFKHKGMRAQLVKTLEEKGITNDLVLEAIGNIPRHIFMDKAFLHFAYEDKAFPIGQGQTISQPYTVAFQTEVLQASKGMKILEIGTGSGYQAAVLCELGYKVFSIERVRPLYVRVKPILEDLGYRPKLMYGDGYKGWPTFAPFDRIIITAGAPHIPQDLLPQLKVGGRMVVPVGQDTQEMILIERNSEQEFVQTNLGEFQFVPMLNKTV